VLEPDDIRIIRSAISLAELATIADAGFGDLVKAVVDIGAGIMAVGGGLHADEEAVLLDEGSAQADLWGVNLYPADHGTPGWVEFDSMINVRPAQGNRSRSVEDGVVRARLVEVVERLVAP
jgi:hypothetical protein